MKLTKVDFLNGAARWKAMKAALIDKAKVMAPRMLFWRLFEGVSLIIPGRKQNYS